jgi:hypothetical protein
MGRIKRHPNWGCILKQIEELKETAPIDLSAQENMTVPGIQKVRKGRKSNYLARLLTKSTVLMQC